MEAHERAKRFATLVSLELAAEVKRRGTTQAAMSKAAGISPQHFSHTTAGRKGALPLDVMMRAAEFLGVDPEEIVARAYARLTDELGTPPATPEPATDIAPRRGPRTGAPAGHRSASRGKARTADQ